MWITAAKNKLLSIHLNNLNANSASVGCHGDYGCATPTVTAQRPCCVNTGSPESGTTGNDALGGGKKKTYLQTHTLKPPETRTLDLLTTPAWLPPSHFHPLVFSLLSIPVLCNPCLFIRPTVFSLIQPKLGHWVQPSYTQWPSTYTHVRGLTYPRTERVNANYLHKQASACSAACVRVWGESGAGCC